MDEKKRLIKQYALNQFNELLNSTTLKVSVFGITLKPIHGRENVKKYLLDAFDEISTSYLTDQDSKEIFRKMNDYMYQATGELAWSRSSSYWHELLSNEVKISSKTPKNSEVTQIGRPEDFPSNLTKQWFNELKESDTYQHKNGKPHKTNIKKEIIIRHGKLRKDEQMPSMDTINTQFRKLGLTS